MPEQPTTAHDAVCDAVLQWSWDRRGTVGEAVLAALGIPLGATANEIRRSSECLVSTCATCGGDGIYAFRSCPQCNGSGVLAVRRADVKRRREQAERLRCEPEASDA